MTKTLAQAAAFALAAVVTTATFAGSAALAQREYVKADAVAMAQVQVLAAQTVVVVGHRS